MKSDIIVIGGGAAGLMAAYGAASTLVAAGSDASVLVLEKMPRPGRKIMITGKGRCNFTNVKDWNSFSAHIRSKANFVKPAFYNLTPEKLMDFFSSVGMDSVVERGDRAYPASYHSTDVIDALVRACNGVGVKIETEAEVASIASEGAFEVSLADGRSYSCSRLVIATGGLSYPGTGSTGDGYMWAEEIGHTVEPCFPSLTALVPVGYKSDKNPLAEEIKGAFRGQRRTVFGNRREARINPLPAHYPKLQGHIERITPMSEIGELFNGNTLENVRLTLYIDGNEAQSEFGDLEFTDGGMEGPIGFQVSRKAVKALMNGSKVSVILDMKPAVEEEKLNEDVHQKWEEVLSDPRSKGQDFKRLFRIMLGKLIPWNLTLAFLRTNPKVSVDTLASSLKGWRFDIAGFVGFERAVVTAGGIATDEIVAKTLESKKSEGLYFCGEVLDMDSDTGGYNLQTAFCTGYLAGVSAAKAL